MHSQLQCSGSREESGDCDRGGGDVAGGNLGDHSSPRKHQNNDTTGWALSTVIFRLNTTLLPLNIRSVPLTSFTDG